MRIKFDEKNHVIKLVYAHDISGRINLEFRTIALTAEDPRSLNDLSKYAFTVDELSELMKNFHIDDFSIQKSRNFDTVAHYLMGQLLTVRSIDSENNANFPKYVLKYEQGSLSNDVKSLIMHTKFGVLAVNLIRESNDVYVNQFVKAIERSYMVMDDEPGVFSVMEGLLHVDINFNSDSTKVRIRGGNTSPQGSITTFTVQGVLIPCIIPQSFIEELESNRPAEISNRLTKMLYELSIPQRHVGSFMTGFFSYSHVILPYSSMNTVSLLRIDQNSYVNALLLQQQASDHLWNTGTQENSPDGLVMVKLWSVHSNVPLPTMKFHVKINSDIRNPFKYMEIVEKHHFRHESRTSETMCSTVHRKKRYSQSDCEPFMDDEKNIFEKDGQSDEISMNSEALLRYVKQNKRAPGKVKQLFHTARKMANIQGAHFLKQVTGVHARQLLEILATTEIPHKLRMIGKWSNRLTMSIMYKNIAVDLYNGNYGGAIFGTTLLGSGYVVPKAVSFMGSYLKTNEIANKIFITSAPFLRRFASGFNIYSLVSSIKQYSHTKDNKDMAGLRGLYSIWDHISKPFQSGKSTFRGFVCENVVGINTGRSGVTFINLSAGFDHVDSFKRGDHFYLIGDEFKVINGNNDTDVFMLNGNQTSGYIHGYGGDDLVDLSNYAKGITRPLIITVDGYHTSIWTEDIKLNLDQLCSYDINLKLYCNSKVDNAAKLGKFVYQIELDNGNFYTIKHHDLKVQFINQLFNINDINTKSVPNLVEPNNGKFVDMIVERMDTKMKHFPEVLL
uniref:Uncharacterized protein n=1 Tax=Romanomermis culicivorax TaxID=13658 RepID=A0A915IVM8_ROMCU